VTAFQEKLVELLPKLAHEPHAVDLILGEMRLTGSLKELSEQGLVRHRLATLKAKDRLHAWILHLALNAIALPGVARLTRWLAEDAIVTIRPIDNAAALLRQLLDCYWEGLHSPLHFFPETSLKYMQQRSLTAQVRNVWTGTRFSDAAGEGDNAYFRLAFRACDPLDEAFERIAVAVYAPLLAASEEQTF
jgi:exodeoxyribonuclease V gamma subunit